MRPDYEAMAIKNRIREILVMKSSIEQKIDKPLFRFDHGLDMRSMRAINLEDTNELDVVINDLKVLLEEIS